jgi:Transposase DDE domain
VKGPSPRGLWKYAVRRLRQSLGARFVDYVVVEGEFATAPFLHAAAEVGWPVVARLKDNLPELFQAAQRRFRSQHPLWFNAGAERVELWEADDFDLWEALRWQISRRSLYAMAKSRWQIENQGFNDAKNRYGLEHLCDHHPRSLLLVWLLTCLALTLERLYRLRYRHRGTHPALTAIDLLRILLLTLPAPAPRRLPQRLPSASSNQNFRNG